MIHHSQQFQQHSQDKQIHQVEILKHKLFTSLSRHARTSTGISVNKSQTVKQNFLHHEKDHQANCTTYKNKLIYHDQQFSTT